MPRETFVSGLPSDDRATSQNVAMSAACRNVKLREETDVENKFATSFAPILNASAKANITPKAKIYENCGNIIVPNHPPPVRLERGPSAEKRNLGDRVMPRMSHTSMKLLPIELLSVHSPVWYLYRFVPPRELCRCFPPRTDPVVTVHSPN
jgi:hypothetical protein